MASQTIIVTDVLEINEHAVRLLILQRVASPAESVCCERYKKMRGGWIFHVHAEVDRPFALQATPS
jgi:hypothetical protein